MSRIHQNKSAWLSGEICQAKGVYFADTCGHAIAKEFVANDIFSRCPTCHLAIRWIRSGGFARPSKSLGMDRA